MGDVMSIHSGAVWMDFSHRVLLSGLGFVESLYDLMLRAGIWAVPAMFWLIPTAVAAHDVSGELLLAEPCNGLLDLHWAEQEGGAAASLSLPGRDMIQILQLTADLAARKG